MPAIYCLVAFLLIESILRFYWFRFSPIHIRLAYAFFLLSAKKFEENYVLAQRVIRGGFSNEEELFSHYSRISGKPLEEIRKKFGREGGWRMLWSREYYSGGHGVLEQVQKMHLGLCPKPNQSLETLEIDGKGLRKTGRSSAATQKVCVLLGGSASFGLGATSDQNTVAGRLEHHLNAQGRSKFKVLNYGMLGFSSHQELLSLLQTDERPNYVLALSGWNEIDQNIEQGFSKVAGIAKSCDFRANRSLRSALSASFLRGFLTLQVARNFIGTFLSYDGSEESMAAKRDDFANNIYPLF